jgi:hypothetical protein
MNFDVVPRPQMAVAVEVPITNTHTIRARAHSCKAPKTEYTDDSDYHFQQANFQKAAVAHEEQKDSDSEDGEFKSIKDANTTYQEDVSDYEITHVNNLADKIDF